MIFRPLIGFKVTIKSGESPKYALRKALVVTRNSTILDSVVEIDIGKSTYTSKGFRWPRKFPYLLTPTLYTLVNAIPAMRQLHTVQLKDLILSRMYLHTILSSPSLIHLILDTVQLPKIGIFPLTRLRKLTLTMMPIWEIVQPLITELATSLEYLELQWCPFTPPSQLHLPSLPCLQEIRYNHQYYSQSIFLGENPLNEILRSASQVTHLHVTGHFLAPVTACQKSLQHLTTSIWMLSEHVFGIEPFPRLMHLSLDFFRFTDMVDRPFAPSSFICDHFPMITSLHLSIPWVLRNYAMAMARSQHNVQVLKLDLYIRDWIMDEGIVPDDPLHRVMLAAALHTLKLEVVQSHRDLERGATQCIRWVFDDVVPYVIGLGGAGLTRIDLSVSRFVERERILSRQWRKAPNDGWKTLE